jgi:hypothetical protein
MSFREGLYFGAVVAVAICLFLLRLWQPEQQVRKHSDHLLKAIADKNWTKFGTLLSEDYHDQWNNNRASVLERTHELFRYLRGVRIDAIAPRIQVESGKGYWRAIIRVDGEENELINELKTRLNIIETPFELEWHHNSYKPWDWKLVAVQNSGLELPSEY